VAVFTSTDRERAEVKTRTRRQGASRSFRMTALNEQTNERTNERTNDDSRATDSSVSFSSYLFDMCMSRLYEQSTK